MHRVPTFHNCCVFQGIEEVLITNGAVMPHGVLHTRVIVTQTNCITRATFVAMKEVFPTSNPAYSTIITMKLPFLDIIIKEITNITKVFSHFDTAVCANLSHWLLCIANGTYHLLDLVPVQLMPIKRIAQHARFFIMTVTTTIDFITARRSNLAPSPIMLAPISHLPKSKPIVGWSFHSVH